MKTLNLSLLVALIAVFFAACSDSTDPTVDSPIFNQTQLEEDVQGDWIITLFEERGVDETADFNGFVFTIDSVGFVTATRDDFSIVGTWSVFHDTDGDCDEDDDDDVDFEHLVSSVDLENKTITLGNGVVVQLTDNTEIDDEDFNTLEEVSNALADGQEVEVDGDGFFDDAGNLIAIEVEFEDVTGENETYDSNTGQAGSSSGDCDDDNDWELVIHFPTDADPLEELNDDWNVISISDNVIELMDVSGGDGHVERLTFTKQ